MSQRCPGEFRVVSYDVPDFSGDHTCHDYGDPHAPRIARLRDEYGLDEVVAGCETEFEGFLALKRWVREQWDHGLWYNRPEVDDGLGILEAVSRGERFFCGSYARVFVDSATALGWPARRVAVSIEDCEAPRDYTMWNVGHAVAEVWSNEHRKWVMMDPDINVHYERDGSPLNALEIREAWLDGAADEVEMVQDQPEFVFPDARHVRLALRDPTCRKDYDEEVNRHLFARFLRNRVMDYYARVRVLTHRQTWEWVDRKCLPTFVSNFRPLGRIQWTSNLPDVYWTVNLVRISTQPSWDEDGARLAVTLSHCMPFFDHYEIRFDDGAWKPCGECFDWPMREGVQSLACRGVNSMNRKGVPSRIEVAYARPPLGTGYF